MISLRASTVVCGAKWQRDLRFAHDRWSPSTNGSRSVLCFYWNEIPVPSMYSR